VANITVRVTVLIGWFLSDHRRACVADLIGEDQPTHE
jgi:hypothetical protein